MFIPLLTLKLVILLGAGCLLCMLTVLVLFGPEAYRFARNRWAGGFPFDAPVWYYRAKRSMPRISRWLRNRKAETEAYGLLILVFVMLWLGLVITNPL